MPKLSTPPLDVRLAGIARLPLSAEGRALAALAARVNELDELPDWLPPDECRRLGAAVASACRAAGLPVARARRLVDPAAAEWEAAALALIRPDR